MQEKCVWKRRLRNGINFVSASMFQLIQDYKWHIIRCIVLHIGLLADPYYGQFELFATGYQSKTYHNTIAYMIQKPHLWAIVFPKTFLLRANELNLSCWKGNTRTEEVEMYHVIREFCISMCVDICMQYIDGCPVCICVSGHCMCIHKCICTMLYKYDILYIYII